MTLNAQMLSKYLKPASYYEDLAHLSETSGAYRSMDPFHFFENNLMRELLNDSDDHDTIHAAAVSAVSRPRTRLPYAKFSASSLEEEAARFFGATRPNSHDVSDNDEQTPQVPAPVVDMRVRRPPGNLTVVVNRPVAMMTTVQHRAPRRQKLSLKRHMDRVLGSVYDERNENCMLTSRVRSLGSSNMVEFIMDH